MGKDTITVKRKCCHSKPACKKCPIVVLREALKDAKAHEEKVKTKAEKVKTNGDKPAKKKAKKAAKKAAKSSAPSDESSTESVGTS